MIEVVSARQVPCFFTDGQRKTLLHAAEIANLNCLKIFNETMAVALAYGIYKQDLPIDGQKARTVVFIDVGHAATQVCCAQFNKAKLVVRLSVCCSGAAAGVTYLSLISHI